jgi:acetyl-CoA C-acetyltransferase
MAEAYIVEAVRTPVGRRKGGLSGVHPADLGAHVLKELVARSGVDPAAVEDVVFGCLDAVGPQAGDIARTAWLAAGLPEEVPGVTIDRQCGSSQQAIQFAAQAVMSGTQDIVIAGGVESMTRVPMFSAMLSPEGSDPLSPTIKAKYGVDAWNQFTSAEMIASKWGLTREMTDAFGLDSQLKAQRATRKGAFDQEIVPIEIVNADGETEMHVVDEGIRWDASPEGMAGVKLLLPDGMLTAATSSQITDGASAAVVASERAVKQYGLTPLARIVNMTVTAGDPIIQLEEPLYATDKALARSGMKLSDIDLYEVNEAFASIPMAWLKHHDADPAKLNVNGGAIALGHPLGASGTKLMATLIYGLKARGGKYGLQTMCEGGGIANVTIIELL